MSSGNHATDTSSRSDVASLWRKTSTGSFALVALGAAMWGTDPSLRQGLALDVPSSAIVAFEQALPAVLLAPLVWRGLRRARAKFDLRDWMALAVLGCGSSALATLLFTLSFTYDRPTPPSCYSSSSHCSPLPGHASFSASASSVSTASTCWADSSARISSPFPIRIQ